jgi:hypothetical protein
MSAYERQRRLELEKEVDDLTAQAIVMWRRIRSAQEELVKLRDDENERQSQSSIEKYRDEMPSETKFSLSPTGARATMKMRPVFIVAAMAVLVGGFVALAWLLGRR